MLITITPILFICLLFLLVLLYSKSDNFTGGLWRLHLSISIEPCPHTSPGAIIDKPRHCRQRLHQVLHYKTHTPEGQGAWLHMGHRSRQHQQSYLFVHEQPLCQYGSGDSDVQCRFWLEPTSTTLAIASTTSLLPFQMLPTRGCKPTHLHHQVWDPQYYYWCIRQGNQPGGSESPSTAMSTPGPDSVPAANQQRSTSIRDDEDDGDPCAKPAINRGLCGLDGPTTTFQGVQVPVHGHRQVIAMVWGSTKHVSSRVIPRSPLILYSESEVSWLLCYLSEADNYAIPPDLAWEILLEGLDVLLRSYIIFDVGWGVHLFINKAVWTLSKPVWCGPIYK